MPTAQDITDAIDAVIAVVLPEIATKQAAFLAEHGRYFQGLCTHSIPPADGNIVAADRLTMHPDYQAENWLDVGYDDSSPQAALVIDQYCGTAGRGYVCEFIVTISGDRWTKRVNVGFDDESAHDWQIEQ